VAQGRTGTRWAVVTAVVLLVAACGPNDETGRGGAPVTTAPAASKGGPIGAASSEGSVSVTLSEFKITLPAASFTPGVKTLTITNAGKVPHELLVFRTDIEPTQFPRNGDGTVNEQASGMDRISTGTNIDPGGTEIRDVNLTDPGTYVFVCNLAGHFAAGMWTKVTVIAAPGGATSATTTATTAVSSTAPSSTAPSSTGPSTTAPGTAGPWANPTLPVNLSEFQVRLPAATVTTGVKTLQIANAGKVPHELLVFHTTIDPSHFPRNGDGTINEDAAGMDKVSDGANIDPGGSQLRTLDLSQAGTYVFLCNLAGHYSAGMYTTVTVVAPPAFADAAVPVELADFQVGLPSATLTTGVKSLDIANSGRVPHELLVFRTTIDPSAFPKNPDGTVNETAPGMNKVSDGDNIDPGAHQARTLDLSQAGTYVFLCNLPGHFAAGMSTVVKVVPPTASSDATVGVDLAEFQIHLASKVLTTGTKTLQITNSGKVPHELLVFRTDIAPTQFPRNADGSINESASGMNKISDGDNLDPGATQVRQLDLTAPGTYVFVCNLPGHFAAGMVTSVTVVAG